MREIGRRLLIIVISVLASIMAAQIGFLIFRTWFKWWINQ